MISYLIGNSSTKFVLKNNLHDKKFDEFIKKSLVRYLKKMNFLVIQ